MPFRIPGVVVGVYADGAECHDWQHAAAVERQLRLHAHRLPYQAFLAVFGDGHDEVEVGDEILVVAQTVHDIMFETSGTIDVPERFSYKILHLAPFMRLFYSDVVGLH